MIDQFALSTQQMNMLGTALFIIAFAFVLKVLNVVDNHEKVI